jgi:myo-inositol-1(or 4)-monophosphatase
MSALSEADLLEIEAIAVELARLAAAEIQTALRRELVIRYKEAESRTGAARYRDPASEADERIEQLIRDRLADRFPEHGVVGEEMATLTGDPDAPVWVIDPIDGTANFVNGLPLFAASIGVMHRGLPVVGAVWCATSHALRPGVYHARAGGPLCFDELPLEQRRHADLRRRLAADPSPAASSEQDWEMRKTGSASLECAFVAAGLFEVARFAHPHLWDVAAGLVLVAAGGGTAREHADRTWRPLEPVPSDAIAAWRRPLLIGETAAVEHLAAAARTMGGQGG